MNLSPTPMHNEFEELTASMIEDEQRLALIFLIIYMSEHLEILTESARKDLEDFANSTASIIEED